MLASRTSLALPSPCTRTRLSARQRLAVRRPLLAAPRCSADARKGASSNAPTPVQLTPVQLLARTAAAAATSCLLLFSGVPPSLAEITTVTPQQATEMAKPLKKQAVNKGRIWLLFTLGATALFGSTVVLENNEKWFPAISRANRAMKAAQEQAAAREAAAAAEQAAFDQRLTAVQAERQVDAVVDDAVLQGLQEARQRSPAIAAAAAPVAVATPLPSPAVAAEKKAPGAVEAMEQDEKAEAGGSSGSVSSSGGAVDSSNGSGSGPSSAQAVEEAEVETRKPLFEISAEQIEASSRLQELQQELERRKAEGAAASAAANASAPEAASAKPASAGAAAGNAVASGGSSSASQESA